MSNSRVSSLNLTKSTQKTVSRLAVVTLVASAFALTPSANAASTLSFVCVSKSGTNKTAFVRTKCLSSETEFKLVAGTNGPAGATGPAGAIGATGPAGANGSSGATGPAGPAGAASTVPGPAGATGTTGATGPAGPAGAASTVPGPQGDTGLQGIQGIQGEAGTPGADGIGLTNASVGLACTAGIEIGVYAWTETAPGNHIWVMACDATPPPG